MEFIKRIFTCKISTNDEMKDKIDESKKKSTYSLIIANFK